MTANEFLRFKESISEYQNRAAKADGAYESHLAQLKKTFGVPTEEAGAELLKELEQGLSEAEATMKKELQSFQDKWGGRL